jgi:hypothetical protein
MGSDQILLNVFHLRLKTSSYIRSSQVLFLPILAYELQEKSVTFQIVIHEFDKNIVVFLHHKHNVYYSVF